MSKTATPKLKTPKPAFTKDVKEGYFTNSKGKEIPYDQSSQATYYFDCKGDGETKGSFCCILKKYNTTLKIVEYFILTAGHNLQTFDPLDKVDPTTSDNIKIKLIQKYLKDPVKYNKQLIYKLKGSSEINLTLVKDYRINGYDVAILKIKTKKILETDFYAKRKPFTNSQDVEKDGELRIRNLIGYMSKSKTIKISDLDRDDASKYFYIDPQTSGEQGDSGCCIFNTNHHDTLLGVYVASGNRGGVIYSKIPNIKDYILC